MNILKNLSHSRKKYLVGHFEYTMCVLYLFTWVYIIVKKNIRSTMYETVKNNE